MNTKEKIGRKKKGKMVDNYGDKLIKLEMAVRPDNTGIFKKETFLKTLNKCGFWENVSLFCDFVFVCGESGCRSNDIGGMRHALVE